MPFPITPATIGILLGLLFILITAEVWKQAIRMVLENQHKHGSGKPPSNRFG